MRMRMRMRMRNDNENENCEDGEIDPHTPPMKNDDEH